MNYNYINYLYDHYQLIVDDRQEEMTRKFRKNKTPPTPFCDQKIIQKIYLSFLNS